MKSLISVVFAALLLFNTPQAYSKTGLDILESLNESDEMYSMASLYLTGLAEGISLAFIAFSEEPVLCIPGNVTNKQMSLVVEKYLKDNPKELHEQISTLAFYAILEAYPCEE